MPMYRYKAMHLDGRVVRGELQAADRTELRELLLGQELYLTDARESQKEKASGQLKPQQLAEFCRELGTMLSAGVPLIRTLSIMAQRDIAPKLKSVYTALFQALKQGKMFSECLEEQGNVFPELLVSMYRAAETSGTLDVTSEKMAEHYEKSYKLAKKVKSAMVYPIILATVTVLVLLVVFLVVLPKFFVLFENLHTELPGITRLMLNLSNGMKEHWLGVLIVVVLLLLGLKMIGQIPKVRVFRDRIKLRLPIVGKLLRIIYTARFARTLSSTYASGVSIVNALANTQNTIGNTYIAAQFPDLIGTVRNGEPLSRGVLHVDGFDSKLAASILIGEETGKLDEMLNAVAAAFDYEAEEAISRLTALLEPCMIVIMAVVVGSIMVSVILPMTTLYDAIGAGA